MYDEAFETAVRELVAFDSYVPPPPRPWKLCQGCDGMTMVKRNRLNGSKIKTCTACGCFEEIVTFGDDGWWDRATLKVGRVIRRPGRTFGEVVALFQGKGDDEVPGILKSDDTPKAMLKKLRKADMRDRIDSIFRYRKVVCGEEPYDLSAIEDDLIRDYKGSGYKENPWYLLYKLLKIKHGYKISLTDFPNLIVNKAMKTEYEHCF